MTDLIKQVIKINNRIFQRERANKGSNKPIPIIEYHNKYRNYGIVQSQQTLAVYKNIKGSNYRGYKIKDFKGKKTNN